MVEHPRTELHPEVRARLDAQRAAGTHLRSSDLSVAGARRLTADTMAASGWLDEPEPVGNVRQYPIPVDGGEIPLRIYTPAGDGPFPVLVWIHGGGWVRDSLDGNDPICRGLANRAGCAVVSVGYRLAPEHPFPVGLEDCYAALEWVVDHRDVVLGTADPVAVGGKSAGGNLTAALALLARDRDGPPIAHQLACVPALDRPRATDSYAENADGYGLTRADMRWYWDRYVARPVDEQNPYAAPLRARDLSGLPPATVLTAGFDPLRDDGLAYVDRLRAAGVGVDHLHYPDMPHAVTGSAHYHEDVGRTREAIGEAADSLRAALAG